MRPVEALQATLRAEHAAVYLYGVLGARAGAGGDTALASTVRAAYEQHIRRRGELELRVRRAGGTPAVAAVGYVVPSGLGSSTGVRSAALDIEDRAAASYAQLAGSTSASNRDWAVSALVDTAVRRLQLGGGPQDLPGQPDVQLPG